MLNKKALAASVSAPPSPFVEDVFSTFLYSGNASTQTISNDIDLSTKGGLVWLKERNLGSSGHILFDTARSSGSGDPFLQSDTTGVQIGASTNYLDYLTNGFTLLSGAGGINASGVNYCSWTFRKAAKFFDVVTYTGNGDSSRAISHSLDSVPGMIIIKRTDASTNWLVAASDSSGNYRFLNLNTTSASMSTDSKSLVASSSSFNVGWLSSNWQNVNGNGFTYVAYLFAHNAGGFGTTGTDNVISCGSYTANGNNTINLGFEPQWILEKRVSSSGDDWEITDNMRGFSMTDSKILFPNSSAIEGSAGAFRKPTATGYINEYWGSGTIIYMAIRRPMKVPTTGTQVFKPVARTGTDSSVTIDAGFTVDMNIASSRNKAIQSNTPVIDRLRGGGINYRYLNTQEAVSETTGTASGAYEFTQNGVYTYNTAFNSSSETYVHWMFKRAPGFFDIVCYTGTGSNRTVAHNLGVAPEFLICKSRNGGSGREWIIYASGLGNTKALQFNNYGSSTDIGYWNNTTPGSSTFTLGTEPFSNTSNELYVAYLFATLAGVSKVGSYTGNGSSQTINCGFTAGARFVLIRKISGTGDWCVFDTARGIVSGNDPFLQLNSTAAEVTGEDALDPDNSGFIVNETTEALNTNAATYIFLAIA
jgi:hypothetical protein